MSVLQLEWAHARVLCWIRAGESTAPLCIAPAVSCSPCTALAAQHPSHREPWAPATSPWKSRVIALCVLICFVVENWGIWPRIFHDCVIALQSHWFPTTQSNSKEPNTPKGISPFIFSILSAREKCKFKSSGSWPLQGCAAAVPCTPALKGPPKTQSGPGWPGHQETKQTLGAGSIWKGRSTEFPGELFYLRFIQVYLKCAHSTLFHLNATPGLFVRPLKCDKSTSEIILRTIHFNRRGLNFLDSGVFSARKEMSKHQPQYLHGTAAIQPLSCWLLAGICFSLQVTPAAHLVTAQVLRAAAS